MFFAILWAVIALASIFVIWPVIFTISLSGFAIVGSEQGGCVALIFAGLFFLGLNGAWVCEIAFCITKVFSHFGVDLPVVS